MAIIKRAVAPATVKAEEEKKSDNTAKVVKTAKPVKTEKTAKAAKTTKTEKTVKAVKATKTVKTVKTEKTAKPKTAATEKKAAKNVEKPGQKKTAKKPAAVKEIKQTKPELYIQYGGHADVSKKDIDKIFEDIWTKDMGRKLSEISTVTYYFKTEESAVYFVVNNEVNGRFDI